MSTFDSYQYSNHTTILCIWAWDRCRSSVWKWLQKKNGKEKHLIDVQLSTDKKLATTQDRQTLQNSDEKQYCQYWILRLVVLTRFPANRDFLLKLYHSHLIINAYPVVCDDEHGGAHNLPRMILLMFAFQFQWLTSTFFC